MHRRMIANATAVAAQRRRSTTRWKNSGIETRGDGIKNVIFLRYYNNMLMHSQPSGTMVRM